MPQVGTLAPGKERPCEVLHAGEVGYMHAGIKSVSDARVGDTLVRTGDEAFQTARLFPYTAALA